MPGLHYNAVDLAQVSLAFFVFFVGLIWLKLLQGLGTVNLLQSLDEDWTHLKHLQSSILAFLCLFLLLLLDAQKSNRGLEQLVGLFVFGQEQQQARLLREEVLKALEDCLASLDAANR